MIALIVALAANQGIGRHGKLPWKHPLKTDMAWFRILSQSVPILSPDHISLSPSKSNVVVMGRKTWHSIPSRFRPLQNRINVVLSRSSLPHSQNTFFIPSFAALDHLPLPPSPATFVIGGHDIYALAIQTGRVQAMFVTEVHESPECDVFFPQVDWSSYQKRDITRDVARLVDTTLVDAFYIPEENIFNEGGISFKMFIYTKLHP
ncbi:dihydrofolate reductase [Encephalitozoon intestinalis ATCC 50506]|uniref:Dihydrofolate reductase n=1 Tax=Encephalitozoon intestinalis (strain ATCC 50506) TaxID=876142 RepID=E0S583_ENCIT|nr:dihydrofolate reductase [Encephalitozoon intestinalis ATCC 50506]XP_003072360.1 dihydrofolate reductase [Encephalitozoon intestinalis ATCC 50506]UTX44500.1 dihydrofolate reductase [Encephalitozoon intestinalis]ADM10868.1 dihydrofolate reductase [Encephalitozoon intestinalis ATCC 50506]ADM11000.1 dihydrofolate reductase [Encephalitozoon intestinalis ATCC 50506]UTX44638.1 dihydrofolate reductase [Encephalitozoon intestinalis]UTX45715.1 dihydrofolate reductase [Encephalitozoon intestinalis]